MTDDVTIQNTLSWIGSSGDWYNADNWSEGRIPTNQDIVEIESDNQTLQITFSQGNPNIGGVNLRATRGGTLDLSGLTQLGGSSSENITVEARDNGSKIDLSDLVTLIGGTNGTSLQFKATNRGEIDLSSLINITGGTTEFIANGVSSLINLSRLTNFTDNAFDRSLIQVENAGVIQVNNLQQATEVDIRSNNSYIALPQLQTINGDNIVEALNRGQIGLPALRTINDRILQIRSVGNGSNVLVSPSLNPSSYRTDLVSGGNLVVSDNLSDINFAPVVNKNISNQTATEDASFRFTFDNDTFLDIDSNNQLTYSATLRNGSQLPDWLNFNSNNRTFAGTPRNDDVGSPIIRVTATDQAGATARRDFRITVNNTNDRPTVTNPLADQTISIDQAFNFTIPQDTFTDIDVGDVLTYSATLSNDNPLPDWLSFNSSDRTFSGTPTASIGDEVIDIKVTVTDQSGESAEDIFRLVVDDGPDAPVVDNPIPEQTATQDQAFTFTFAENTFSDPDFGDSVTYTATGESGEPLPNWLSFDPNTRTFSGTPTNDNVGSLTLGVTATDTTGLSTTTPFNLTVANINDPPQLNGEIPDQDATENLQFTYQIPPSLFSDPDPEEILTLDARLVNGESLPSWLNFNPSSGILSGIPTPNDIGSLMIAIAATDLAGASVSDTFTLTIGDVNNAPIVVNPIESQTAIENTPFSFQIPNNTFADPDPEDTLTYAVTQADGRNLPAWLSFDSDSLTLSGTPTTQDIGNLNLVVFASDPQNFSTFSAFTLTVTDANDLPIVTTPLPDQLWSVGLPLTYTLPVNTFSDPDPADTLTYSATLADESSLPSWLIFDPTTATFSGTATEDQAGLTYEIVVTATDSRGGTAQDTFQIPVTGAFDPAQYGATNLDVADAFGYDLAAFTSHFINAGRFELRAIDNFNELLYQASNPDLIVAFGFNPALVTEHYLISGRFENRSLDSFDPEQYLASYSDLLAFFGNDPNGALIHYLTAGFNEGREGDLFDELRYVASYGDLIEAFGTDGAAATDHYLSSGFLENRDPLLFNPAEYIAGYEELINDIGYDLDAGTRHYIETGYEQGRTDDLFNSDIYIASHGDLIEAFGYNLAAGAQHYIVTGVSEMRATDLFDPVNYLSNYEDLQMAFGEDVIAATRHYIEAGYFEGRTYL